MRSASCCLVLAAFFAATAANADVHNSFQVHVNVNGTKIDQTGGLSNDGTGLTRTLTAGSANVDIEVNANQFTSAKASVSGNGNGYVKVQSGSTYSFNLKPPAGAASVKGGKVVFHVVLEGTAIGDADIHLVSAVQSDMGKATGSAIISSATAQKEEFDVVLPIAPFIEDIEKVSAEFYQHLDATARINGTSASSAEAKSTTRVVSFRVFNSAGAQVPGFTMIAAGGNVPEAAAAGPNPPPASAKVQAVEFYNATFKHYFVSANPGEIAKLDDGTFAGWTRTGQAFNVNAASAAGLAAVCRFFTVAFPPTSSHFYAPRGLGCEGTLANAKWQFEGDVFYVPLPSDAGVCPANTVPVFRLYNNGRGGAPNHRFTTSTDVRAQMIAEGFVAEGAGTGVGFCSPQ